MPRSALRLSFTGTQFRCPLQRCRFFARHLSVAGQVTQQPVQRGAAPERLLFACNGSLAVILVHGSIGTVARHERSKHPDHAAGRNLDSGEMGRS
jgi:hypothetical protein